MYTVPTTPMLNAATRARWRPLAGVASAVIPTAVLVHLVAEGLSLGRAGLTIDFVLRHVYLAALVIASLVTFGRTVGIGSGRVEMRRRTALLRAAVTGTRRPAALAVLVIAYLAFFALTQAGEGLPIASGALWLGLAAGTIGSLLSALLVYAFGRAVFAATLAVLGWSPRRSASDRPALPRVAATLSRAAATAFSLFVPNRPPPMHPFTRIIIITRSEGIHLCSIWSARRDWRLRSFSQRRTA